MKKTLLPILIFITVLLSSPLSGQKGPSQETILNTMKKATAFMADSVSRHGGYVWDYTPDRSRAWGEMEAKPTMIWTQPPGTPSMGNLFLDAYHATGDEYYYRQAEKAAAALIWGQLECGGWNYIIDFAGEASLKEWYATIGRNGWRLEEFRHYYGNATFDDEATYGPALFLLRMYTEKYDPTYKPALDKAIRFVLESQYPCGGWPQRYPLRYDYPEQGRPDYSSFITLNDDVHKNNVLFLIRCYQALGDPALLEPIRRAMDCILILQQGDPQSGWSWQYTTELEPAGARTYEPWGLYSGATVSCTEMLMDYYELTGETKYLARIPQALEFLDSIELPSEMARFYPRELRLEQRLYPSCVETGTNKPLYVHRRGSNTSNGSYYADYNPERQWMPTFSMRALNTQALKRRYEKLIRTSPEEACRHSPLKSGSAEALPRYVNSTLRPSTPEEVGEIVGELRSRNYWEGIFANSNPYAGEAPEDLLVTEDYGCTQVGDRYDTSPYRFGEDFKGISTQQYINNMAKLIRHLTENGQPGR